MTSCIALIPARAGSQRVPGKNIRLLGGKPLMVWTIEAAVAADLDHVFVSSDAEEIGAIGAGHGAVFIRRPAAYATAESPDIEWVRHAVDWLGARELRPDILAILRPTSPFRGSEAIRGARALLEELGPNAVDSVRAVRRASEHPAKCWLGSPGSEMRPALESGRADRPWHSMQTNTLPLAYVQTAGMELVWRNVISRTNSIAGHRVAGYLLEGPAALDINTKADWAEAEELAAQEAGTAGVAEERQSKRRHA